MVCGPTCSPRSLLIIGGWLFGCSMVGQMEAVDVLVGCALRRRVYIYDSGILIPLLQVGVLGWTMV